MHDVRLTNQNSASWMFFARACFIVSILAMATAVVFLPAQIWVKGYIGMGTLLVVASSFVLQKSIRDDFEAMKLNSQLSEAKAERMIKDLDVAA